MKHIITTILVLLVITFSLQEIVSAQHKSLAEATLVVDSFFPQQDSLISIGILVLLKDDWHIYWRNPGDSGIPTNIEFNLPEGITVSEIKFPIPELIADDEIVNYGYKHQVLFLSDLKFSKVFKLKEINLSAKITSLICKDICKPFDTVLSIKLDISKDIIADRKISQLFESTKLLLPKNIHTRKTTAKLKSDIVYLTISDEEIVKSNSIKFLSYDAGIFRNSTNQKITRKENIIEIQLEPDPFRVKNPAYINGILVFESEDKSIKSKHAIEINLPIAN